MTAEVTLGCIFGAIHCTGWSYKFPGSHIELLIWRISSVVLTGVPLLMGLSLSSGLAFKMPGELPVWLKTVRGFQIPANVFFVVGVVTYIIARLFLLALAFSTLRHLPDGSLRVISWASLIPHFG
jgi:hypothetical protein